MSNARISLETAKAAAEDAGLDVCGEGLHGGCGASVGCDERLNRIADEWERLMDLYETTGRGLGLFTIQAVWPKKAIRVNSYALKHVVEQALPSEHKYISNATMILYLAAVGVKIQPVKGSKNPYVCVRIVG